jgi:hypothetical protein
MSLIQVIYSSQPFAYDEATLGNLLVKARSNNLRDRITGALICRRDIYLQLLEGPKSEVMATLARVRYDDRHMNLTLHQNAPITQRMFGDWAMLHDPAKSWLWPEAQVDDGVPKVAVDDIKDVFRNLAEAKAD